MKKRRKGPYKRDEDKKPCNISVALSEVQMHEVQAYAKGQGLRPSTAVRELVLLGLGTQAF